MTTTPWEKFPYGPWAATTVVPQLPPDEDTRRKQDLPATLRPVPGEGVVQHPVYDPAANHHLLGMRLSEPRFADPDRGEAWFAARRHALDHVLAAIAGSPWAEHLVLRGSVLLKAWFGDAAREPGDLDFVVVPDTWLLADDRTDALLDGIARAAEAVSRASGGPVRIDAAGAVSDEIWTYDRVPGRRLVLPWTAVADDVPPGTVQLDFVFNETLPAPPVRTGIPPLADGQGGRHSVALMAASPELSLVWKVLWLVSDMHPEAKDLYDAVLLAESVTVPYELLDRVLSAAGEWSDLPSVLREAGEVDWPEFEKDHPHDTETGGGYLLRLVVALSRGYVPDEDSAYARLAVAFEDVTGILREEHAAGGMEAVESWFAQRVVSTICAVITVRELLGRSECTLREAADVVVSLRDRRHGRHGDEDRPAVTPYHGDPREIAARLEAMG
ncbi:nucleotidyl transferase AbiEii/AbiGii toxin family protein [Streptomyces sp. UNOB3_S3]|uniref:nucleotidyl transferase AbiEii/AbiGii toxin family protein n=1 Tax=Streptomyces sp. UNOB3_S3 TaxID=2871682 RepID=UPI001E4B8E71|nr:nucleotidyl transferase AbiEii/AbiGii toxin family protein [Streptomyces sp. UNOB3_S3]MCC3778169.1 nucleotidyl transferase AbiEii/AbiGii toxin family protein [Streptomyces sp. UNOB3_S3]